MAEKQQPLILALGRGYNGFYCPKTRFHLVGVLKPQAPWPEGTPLSEDAKRGLRGGTLIDVNKLLTEEDLHYGENEGGARTSSDLKTQILVSAEDEVKKQKENYDPETHTGSGDDTYVAKDFKEATGELISEADILSSTKKELLEYIEKQGIELEGINSRSNADDVKKALIGHFGYDEKPKNYNNEE